MTAPLPDGLINAITRWGNTTINISRQLGLPQSDEARIERDFLTALHPDRYSRQFHTPPLTHVDQLAELLWRSILNAHIQPNRIPLPNYAPPTATAQSGSWRPTQPSVDPWVYAASPPRSQTSPTTLATAHNPDITQQPDSTTPKQQTSCLPKCTTPPTLYAPWPCNNDSVPWEPWEIAKQRAAGGCTQHFQPFTSTGLTLQEEPSPPSPTPTPTSLPMPSPKTDPYELPMDDKGIIRHSNNQHLFKVTIQCWCLTSHKTSWGVGKDPHKELRQLGWNPGTFNGNTTWQKPRCPLWPFCGRPH